MKLKVLRFLDIAVEYSVYGLLFFIPISIAMVGSFAGSVLVLFLLKQVLSPDFSSVKSNKLLFVFLFLFFVFMGLSVINSGPLAGKSLNALLIKWGRFPLLIWAIIDTFRDARRLSRAVYALLFSATLVGLSVFMQKFFGFDFLRGRALAGSGMPVTGPFKNQNGLSAYLTCVIPLFLSLALWRWRSLFIRVGLFLIGGLLILSSFWAFSRGGWLGVIAGLIFLVLVINYPRIKKFFWVVFLSIYISILPLIGIALFFFHNRRDGYRFTLFHGVWGMINDHPLLGMGLGTFMDYCALYTGKPGVFYAHNCFLQIWAESGIFSLLFFILFLGYIFYKIIKLCFIAPASLSLFACVGLAAGLFGFLIHSFFEVHLYSFQLSFLFWTVLGLTIALSVQLRRQDITFLKD
jgi:O-antigen ligase